MFFIYRLHFCIIIIIGCDMHCLLCALCYEVASIICTSYAVIQWFNGSCWTANVVHLRVYAYTGSRKCRHCFQSRGGSICEELRPMWKLKPSRRQDDEIERARKWIFETSYAIICLQRAWLKMKTVPYFLSNAFGVFIWVLELWVVLINLQVLRIAICPRLCHVYELCHKFDQVEYFDGPFILPFLIFIESNNTLSFVGG